MIEQRLNELLADLPDNLSKAMRYAVLGSGKRIRPRLVQATSETLGTGSEIALDPACAIEMVHAYSLIHDDLPCMDNDDFRRGKPTVHRAFSEPIAILAGDALLTEAFHILAKAPQLNDQQIIQLITSLAYYSGCEGMVKGQIMDIQSINQTISPDFLMEMHRKKTGALLKCSLEFGAIIAKATPAQKDILHKIGDHLGLAYQLQDDLLDAEQKSEEEKPNAVRILGKKITETLFKQSIQEIHSLLEQLPNGGQPIEMIIASVF